MRRPSPASARTMVVAALALAGAAVVVGLSAPARPASPAPSTPVAVIAHRVELLRHERFRRPIEPVTVTPAQARRDSVGDLDRTYPPARRAADEETLELLGLLPPGADLRALLGTAFGQQVAGYYDPRSKRLRVVSTTGAANPVLDEIVLSHELTHALEDQRFGLPEGEGGTDDRSTARTALLEGTATQVMAQYAARYIRATGLTAALAALGRQSDTTKLPRYLQDSLEFPYEGGLSFVQALLAHGGWRLVDRAETTRPPVSTEQILHPAAYLTHATPLPVALPRAAAVGRGWRRAAAGTLGEWDTRELLSVGGVGAGDAQAAAAGWGGGRYALFQRGGAGRCAAPCRARDVLAVRWRWDTAKDARDFGAVLRVWLATGRHARPAGAGTWRVGDSFAHVRDARKATTLIFAPTATQASRLAR